MAHNFARRVSTPRTALVASLAVFAVTAIACGGKLADQWSRGEHRVISDGDGGWITEPNCFADGGGYDFCTNNCHHAANCGLDAGNDGIISCDGYPNGNLGGHTVNWDEVPYPAGAGGGLHMFCASNPQAPGAAACCWVQNTTTPNVTTGPGSTCAQSICGTFACTPIAFPPNVPWNNGPLTCSGAATSLDCLRCCSVNRDTQIQWCAGSPPVNPAAPTSPIDCSNPPDAALPPVEGPVTPVDQACLAQVAAGTAACNASCSVLPVTPPIPGPPDWVGDPQN